MLGGADPVGVDRLGPSRVGLTAPAKQELLRGGLPARDDVVRDGSVLPSASRAERATIPIICAEMRPRSVRACSSEISFSFPSRQ